MFVTVHAEDTEQLLTGDRCLLGWQTRGAAGPATYGTGTAENPVGETDWGMELGNSEKKEKGSLISLWHGHPLTAVDSGTSYADGMRWLTFSSVSTV